MMQFEGIPAAGLAFLKELEELNKLNQEIQANGGAMLRAFGPELLAAIKMTRHRLDYRDRPPINRPEDNLKQQRERVKRLDQRLADLKRNYPSRLQRGEAVSRARRQVERELEIAKKQLAHLEAG